MIENEHNRLHADFNKVSFSEKYTKLPNKIG